MRISMEKVSADSKKFEMKARDKQKRESMKSTDRVIKKCFKNHEEINWKREMAKYIS